MYVYHKSISQLNSAKCEHNHKEQSTAGAALGLSERKCWWSAGPANVEQIMQAVNAGLQPGMMLKPGLGIADAVAVAAQHAPSQKELVEHFNQLAAAPHVWAKLTNSSSGHSDASQHQSTSNSDAPAAGLLAAIAPAAMPEPQHCLPAASSPSAAAARSGSSPASSPTAHTETADQLLQPAGAATSAPQGNAAGPAAKMIEQPAVLIGDHSLPQVQQEQHQQAEEQPVTPRTAARKAAAGPPPSPLPPPSAAEGPQAAEEYEQYLKRFAEGVTLRQRWHRLAVSGRIDDIRADWEEWQHDRALQELQQQIQQQGKGSRRRRDEADVDTDAPRQTRQRRVPSTLQDYAVETPVAATAAATGSRDDLQQRSSKAGALAGGGVAGDEEGDAEGDACYSEGTEVEHQLLQRGRAPQGPLRGKQQATRGGYRGALQQQAYGRQQQQQQQPWGRVAPQQQQLQEAMALAGSGGITPELMAQLYQMGTAMGAALQQQAGGTGGTAAGSAGPHGLPQMMELCARMFGGDPAAFTQHMAQQIGASMATAAQQ